MPRTTAVECPGCPPFRALTFDALGLIKGIEARGKEGGVPKVVERWGDPDASKCVLAASIDDRKTDPLLAVARKSGRVSNLHFSSPVLVVPGQIEVEVLNPLNGELSVTVSIVNSGSARPEDDAIVGLHLFRRQRLELTSRSCTLLTCTTKGNASIRSVEMTDSPADSGALKTWSVCASGNISCSQVDGSESYAIFGGKGVEVNMWDLDKCTKIWTGKPPPKNSLGIFTPTWFTSATFLSKDDHRKVVAGTNSHQVRLYDVSAQRRPVISFDFRETSIKAVTEDLDGHTIYIGNGSGDLASVDIRTGKLLGCFLGKCSGSIRSIARHPELPVIASCGCVCMHILHFGKLFFAGMALQLASQLVLFLGLDSYLRIWDIGTRQLLSSVFLKQHLTKVVFDTNFTEGISRRVRECGVGGANNVMVLEVKHSAADSTLHEAQSIGEVQSADETEKLPTKRKKSSKEDRGSRKKASKVKDGSKKLKSKKRSKSLENEFADDA
ncbi:Transducin/WD40 repeat-like superfamily protein [Theobroma cacao]|uniref:Transducin/WD40 repeat-like superfamily protein n=1 Tax=Theobroma cacao TaxID=3641 RepID=A0A061G5U8_THECC|nr:Transducin/WD40 repeat-like superfamily protein [Theobroma cacao]